MMGVAQRPRASGRPVSRARAQRMLPGTHLDGQVAPVATPVQQVPARRHLTTLLDRVQQPPPRRPHLIGRIGHLNRSAALLEKIKQPRSGRRRLRPAGKRNTSTMLDDRHTGIHTAMGQLPERRTTPATRLPARHPAARLRTRPIGPWDQRVPEVVRCVSDANPSSAVTHWRYFRSGGAIDMLRCHWVRHECRS